MTSVAPRSLVGRNRPWYRMRRWMYRDGHPNALARLLLRVDVAQLGAGRLSPERAVLLEVRNLDLAPGARAHIPVDRHAPVGQFEAIAADYPVFRIAPAAPAS